jgi:membrane-associated phospholipid phosphatase
MQVPVSIAMLSASFSLMGDHRDEARALSSEAETELDQAPSPSHYFPSTAAIELTGSIIFFLLCMIPYLAIRSPRIRPIPFQKLLSEEYVRNLSLDEVFDSDTVSTLFLVIISGVLPLLMQLILAKWVVQIPSDVHHSICIYLIGFGLTFLVTDSLKCYIGFLRPSFYDLCEPNADYSACMGIENNDSRKSFPSGHASTAFCGLSIFSKYLERCFGISSVREIIRTNNSITLQYRTNTPHLNRLNSILSLIPIALAIFIAASRVVDNKHFPADVVGGSLLGAACASFAYRLWFGS